MTAVETKMGKLYAQLAQRKCIYYVDDVNMPKIDLYRTQSPMALLILTINTDIIVKQWNLKVLTMLLLATDVIRICANRLFDHVDYQAKDIVIGQTIKNSEWTPDSQAARDESMFCAFPIDGDNSALDESGYVSMITQDS